MVTASASHTHPHIHPKTPTVSIYDPTHHSIAMLSDFALKSLPVTLQRLFGLLRGEQSASRSLFIWLDVLLHGVERATQSARQ